MTALEYFIQISRLFSPVDPWSHIVADAEAEKKWRFSLRTTLESKTKAPLLSGYSVCATKSVLPPPAELKGGLMVFFKKNRLCGLTF